ncbi:glycoside hydrolase family 5 protein [Schizopora paradoxa]|uniref:mannan endo-1,4-beta-mannosidase n=1 Tax=Schizopora paradoxa TaxID=27342 RepID=A0A0H2RR63_9AGAM|nr:glycoside hydrolase family 5 protein [Schizopora paradoxa]
MVFFTSHLLSLFTILYVFAGVASAGIIKPRSFSGSNLYYAPGLSKAQRTVLLDGMQSAGMKVLRVWISAQTTASTKNTTITPYNSVEPDTIGVYDDTVLELLDDFMLDSFARGIKLIISMHSYNSLASGDVYSDTYGVEGFYENTTAQAQFDARLVHIMNHKHKTLRLAWKYLSPFIFAFEAENEAMIGLGQQYIVDHPQWQCDRATTIKNQLPKGSNIMVTTGGASWLDESVQQGWLDCPAIDIVAVHAYGAGDLNTTKIESYVDLAKAAGSRLMFQEWGACYYDTANNVCDYGDALDVATRNANIALWADQITAAGLPWLYWQVLPNADPHYDYDYEIGVNTDPSWPTLKKAALRAAVAPAAFDFSDCFLGL